MSKFQVKTTLAIAIRAVLLSAPVLTLGVLSTSGYAATTQTVKVNKSTLDQALKQLAIQTGITISYDAQAFSKINSNGLQGQYSPEQALEKLLQPVNLEAVRLENGGFSIKPRHKIASETQHSQLSTTQVNTTTQDLNVSASEVTQLPAIIVTANQENPLTTEGTKSYTAKATTASTGLTLSLKETPQLVSVVTRQQMEDQGLTQLMDVAAIGAGLSVSSPGNVGSDSSPIYSRGFVVSNYLLDGVKLLNSYSSIYQSQDMAMFDRVEVVRGATGLMTGSGSPSASINLVRKKPTNDLTANISVTGGSWDYLRADTDVSSPLNEDGSIRGRLIMAAQQNDSYIDRLEEDRKVVYAVIEGDITEKTKASFAISHQEINQSGSSRGGLPAWYADGSRTHWKRSDSAASEWASSERHTTGFFADLEHQFNDNWKVKTSLSRTITDSDEIIGYVGGTPNQTGTGALIWATRWDYRPIQDIFSTIANGKFDLFGQTHELAIGGTLAKSDNNKRPAYQNWPNLQNSGWDNTIPNINGWNGQQPANPNLQPIGWSTTEDSNNSAFIALRFKLLDSLALLTGARVEDWKRDSSTYRYATGINTSSTRKETGEVTPYVGLVFDLTDDWSTYASYTTIFAPQNNIDIHGKYLDPEVGKSVEFGIKGAFFEDALNIGAAVYKTEQDNKAIALKATDGTNILVDGQQAYEALNGTESKGLELEITGKIAEGWQLSSSFSRNITVDRDGNKLNTTVPQNTARLFTTYTLPYFDKALQIGGGVRWQNEMYTLNSGPNRVRLTQSEVTLVDLMAKYKFNDHLSSNLNISNLFDEKYYATAGNSYYGQPRNIRVGVSYNW
ncbi:TonB-dependent siderophore receptor [Acinetobacter wuhouensis]|uniref:TonB-dependent siderophore receptor n=1 Tax=Acinetobacter wuhouensis TaxID=1879050 RepID=A0A3G2T173_9GAMM|nr:TonB-dependent receptor [Acinetobacter wuhouensis]AYO53775.1 TonB-dependent siderophore receptor [Acinetobacter wuhouensis]